LLAQKSRLISAQYLGRPSVVNLISKFLVTDVLSPSELDDIFSTLREYSPKAPNKTFIYCMLALWKVWLKGKGGVRDDVPSDRILRNSISVGLFDDPAFSDVLLHVEGSNGKESFPSHKNLLAPQSQYFRTLFTTGMKEKGESEITLKNVDNHMAFSMMMRFMTKGEVEVSSVLEVTELLYMANRFHVPQLERCCMEFLLGQIENVKWITLWETTKLVPEICDEFQERLLGYFLRKTHLWVEVGKEMIQSEEIIDVFCMLMHQYLGGNDGTSEQVPNE